MDGTKYVKLYLYHPDVYKEQYLYSILDRTVVEITNLDINPEDTVFYRTRSF